MRFGKRVLGMQRWQVSSIILFKLWLLVLLIKDLWYYRIDNKIVSLSKC